MLRDIESIDTIIIHCADTPDGVRYNAKHVDEWHKLVGFQRDLAAVKNFNLSMPYIGYHKVIGIHGHVEEGRGLDEVGSHARGHNKLSVGICLIGRERFTAPQWNSLRREVEMLLRAHPGLKIIGHRDVEPHKTCPGFDVAAWLAAGMNPLEQHIFTKE